jgi:hypothetical protein
MGDLFEGSADLTILPCSAKGTITSAAARWKHAYGVSSPQELGLTLKLGGISPIFPFPGPQNISKFFCYAASVLNDHSSAEVIESIGTQVGKVTSERDDIRIVESPLLGTGAGGLFTEVAGRSLSKGFLSASSLEATLFIFVYDRERFEKLGVTLGEQGVLQKVWDAVGIRPGILGINVDVKKLLKK